MILDISLLKLLLLWWVGGAAIAYDLYYGIFNHEKPVLKEANRKYTAWVSSYIWFMVSLAIFNAWNGRVVGLSLFFFGMLKDDKITSENKKRALEVVDAVVSILLIALLITVETLKYNNII